MSYNAIVAGAAFIRIAMDDASLRKGLKDAQNRVNGFAKSWEIMKSKLSLGNSNAFMYFSNAILPMSNLINQYKEFNDQILALKAISGASTSQVKSLEKYIRQLGSTTAFTAKQVAQGAVELSRMGFSTDDVQAGLKPALDLVRATGQETWRLGDISAYAASALRIFGLQGKDFADVCDVMAYAANASNADIDDLGEALKIAGPSAKVVNEDLRDTAAALMLMSNAGIKGSLAGTSLRKIYQSLAAQSGKTAGLSEDQIKEGMRGIEAMQKLGVKMLDPETGNLRKAADIMSDLAKAITTMKSGEKVNFATEVFDLRGSLGALTMFNDPAALQNFRKNLDDVSGYAEKTAKEMETGIGGVTRNFFSRLQDLGLTIGKMAAEIFLPILRFGVDAFEKINKFITKNSYWVRLIGGITMGCLALGAALKVVAVTMGLVETAFSPLYKVVKVLNDFVVGLGKVKKAVSGDVPQRAMQIAERFKVITKEKADTARKASEDIRHHEEMVNAAKEAQMIARTEAKKLEAAKADLVIAQEAQKAEQLKALAQKRADAVRIASENRRHYLTLKNAHAEAQAVAASEARKLSVARLNLLPNRTFQGYNIAELSAMSKKNLGAVLKGIKNPETRESIAKKVASYQILSKEVKAQEKALAAAQKSADKIAKSINAAQISKSKSFASANAVTASYRTLQATPASELSGKRSAEVIAAQRAITEQTRIYQTSLNNITKAQEEVDASRIKMQASTQLAAAAQQRYNEALTASDRVSARHIKTLGKINVTMYGFNGMALKRTALIWKSSVAEIAAAKAAAAGVNKVTFAYKLNALFAKTAAGATLALNRAFKFLAANWVTIALTAIAVAYTHIAAAADSAKQAIRDYNEEQTKGVRDAEKETEAGDKQAKKDRAIQARLRELEELSKQRRLTSKELAEAESLKEKFSRGSDVKINIAKGTVKTINDLSFNQLERSDALKRVHKELNMIDKKLKSIDESRAKLSETDRDDKTELAHLAEEEKEMLEKQVALRQRLKAISRGERNAIVGEDTMLGGDNGAMAEMTAATQKVVDAQKHILEIEKQIARFRRTAFQERLYQLDEEYKKAKESFDTVIKADEAKLEQLKERNAELGKHRSEENIKKDLVAANAEIEKLGMTPSVLAEMEKRKKELADTISLQKKYALLGDETMQAALQAKFLKIEEEIAVDEAMLKPFREAQKKYDELITELQNSRQAFDERLENSVEQKAVEAHLNEYKEKLKAAQEFFDKRQNLIKTEEQKQRDEIDNFLTDMAEKRKQTEARTGEEKTISKMLKSGDKSGAIAFINDLLNGATKVWQQAAAKYEQMKKDFSAENSEGGIGYGDKEQEEFKRQQEIIKEAESRMQGYRERLASAQEAMEQSPVSTSGSFSLRSLAAALGGGTAIERTANATEEQVALQKKIYKELQKENNSMVWS